MRAWRGLRSLYVGASERVALLWRAGCHLSTATATVIITAGGHRRWAGRG
ncbi:MAG: hypothetical protein IKR05_00980 [Prevotella sp.]|nr:hypothetical protein [Prevotella sp.]MBR6980854.1 hypothetical protein [Prevotella sp.]